MAATYFTCRTSRSWSQCQRLYWHHYNPQSAFRFHRCCSTVPHIPLPCCNLHVHQSLVWASCRTKSIKDCLFGVAYNGNFDFMETVKQGKGVDYMWLEQQQKLGKMPSHDATNVLPEAKLESKIMTVQEALTYVNNAVVCKHNENVSMCKDCLLQRVKRETLLAAAKDIMPFKHEQDSTKEYGDEARKALKLSSASHLLNHPMMMFKTLLQQQRVLMVLTYHNKMMWILYAQTVQGYRLLATTYYCLAQFVIWQKTQKACVLHIEGQHLEYKFKCNYCEREFPHHNSLYHHEKEHQAPSYICSECSYACSYKSQQDRHVAVHQEVLPYGCAKCDKRFASEKSIKRHAQVHEDLSFTCSVCGVVKTTQERLYTHFRGAHGKGYTARCGHVFQWPGTCARHQGECDQCKEVAQQVLNKWRYNTETETGETTDLKGKSLKKEQNVKTEDNIKPYPKKEQNVKTEQKVKQEVKQEERLDKRSTLSWKYSNLTMMVGKSVQ